MIFQKFRSPLRNSRYHSKTAFRGKCTLIPMSSQSHGTSLMSKTDWKTNRLKGMSCRVVGSSVPLKNPVGHKHRGQKVLPWYSYTNAPIEATLAEGGLAGRSCNDTCARARCETAVLAILARSYVLRRRRTASHSLTRAAIGVVARFGQISFLSKGDPHSRSYAISFF